MNQHPKLRPDGSYIWTFTFADFSHGGVDLKKNMLFNLDDICKDIDTVCKYIDEHRGEQLLLGSLARHVIDRKTNFPLVQLRFIAEYLNEAIGYDAITINSSK